jgi:hypothetical protein
VVRVRRYVEAKNLLDKKQAVFRQGKKLQFTMQLFWKFLSNKSSETGHIKKVFPSFSSVVSLSWRE